MVQPAQQKRFFWMVLLLAIAFAGLGYRLVDLQVIQRGDLLVEAENRTKRTFMQAPLRGNIYDRRLNLLAGSEVAKSLNADLSLIGTNQLVAAAIARAAAPILQTNETYLLQRLQMVTYTNREGQVKRRNSIPLKKQVKLEDWEKLKAVMSGLDFGIDERSLSKSERRRYADIRAKAIVPEVVDDQIRFYPHGTLAAHILGFVGTEQKSNLVQTLAQTTGKAGIEAMMNSALTGIAGWRKTEVARGRELTGYRDDDVVAQSGHHVVLTIDSGVQHIVEAELAEAAARFNAPSASAVVVRPRTGEILALANVPTYNPNAVGTNVAQWRNRAITDIYEPGSTFKIVPIAGALNEGLVTLDTVYDCENGLTSLAGKRLKDVHAMGRASVSEIIAHSSNIGTAKVALNMGAHRTHDYVRRFGFGERTGIELQGEENGTLLPPEKWGLLRTTRIAIGQGVAVTPIQMAMAMSAIANGGKLMKPLLVDRVIDDEGRVVTQNQPTVVREVLGESAVRSMVTALKRVVSTNGTAPLAVLDHYHVAGKTGTAEMTVEGRLGYVHGRYISSFAGFLPADDPELCIVVILHDLRPPIYYGGKTAAPTFQRIADRTAKYLAIKPDVTPQPLDAQMVSNHGRSHGNSTNH